VSSYDASTRLRDFLAVTEPALTRLGVDQLPGEVLERVREALGADTAALLLHEGGTDYLVARVARGLEEEVRQGVRVPIGTGFSGRIAQTRRPVRLRQVDASTVSNPILWEKGIQRMLGVPLLNGAELLGVLHVGRLEQHDFDASDEALLQIAAERLSAAVQSRRYADEAAAADLLKRGLLPARLPRVAGVQLASRYVPTETRTIGGDWYDTFRGPDQALWMVTGDVAGHGLHAAVVMGRVKSALRAYTLLGEGPARVLELTDRKVDHFEMGAMITVVCARAYPPFEVWTISSAGHPPPVLAVPGQPTALTDVRPCPPLGAQPGCARTETTVTVPLGGLLMLYTDGLIERRDEALDAGLERLRGVVRADHPDIVCRTVMHELVGSQRAMDDIAVLALRRELTLDVGDQPPSGRSERSSSEVLA
jgi:serine phosphatase RsbU (regulator of sigma subunit)